MTFDSRSEANYKAESTHHISTSETHFGVDGKAVAPYYLAPEEYKGIRPIIRTEINHLNRQTPQIVSTEENQDTLIEIGTEDITLDDRLDTENEDLFRNRYTKGVLTTLENDMVNGIIDDLDF